MSGWLLPGEPPAPGRYAVGALGSAESGMAFRVYGIYKGKPVQVTWTDGRLEGDPALVERLEGYVAAGEPIDFTEDGVVEADLADPARALALIVYEIPVVTGLEGDPPPGIDFAAELAELQQDQQLQPGRARRWWSWGR
jgi:hypothetical protein